MILTQDTLDIGAYDRAAVRLAYADVADVWDEPQHRELPAGHRAAGICSTQLQRRVVPPLHSLLDGFGGLTGPLYNNGRK